MVSTRRKLTNQVGGPEQRVEPKRVPGPPFDSPIWHEREKSAKKSQPERGETVRPIQPHVCAHWNGSDNRAEYQEARTDDSEADPADQ
jgi:hypothetical protein